VLCKPISEERDIPSIPTHEFVASIKSKKVPANEQITPAMLEMFERAASGDIFLAYLYEGTYSHQSVVNVHASLCHSCKDISLWKHDTVLFPPHRYEIEPNQDMNDDIRADFDEARSILDLSPRGAAALLRLCIQKLCVQLGKPGKNLNDDIASLVRDGLSVEVQQALDVVRVNGNAAVHPGELDLKDDRETAARLFELVNYIAEERITNPKKLAKLYSTLPPKTIAAIEERDGTKPKSS
jgi:hypothetical protein